jgi:hypothetical protein
MWQYSTVDDICLFGETAWIDLPGKIPFVVEGQVLRHIPSGRCFFKEAIDYVEVTCPEQANTNHEPVQKAFL